MRPQIRAPNMELSPSVRKHIEERLGSELGGIEARIDSVSVFLAELRGGVDAWCLIVARLEPSGQVTAEATEADIETAVNQAIDLIARRMEGVLERAPEVRLPWLLRHG